MLFRYVLFVVRLSLALSLVCMLVVLVFTFFGIVVVFTGVVGAFGCVVVGGVIIVVNPCVVVACFVDCSGVCCYICYGVAGVYIVGTSACE